MAFASMHEGIWQCEGCGRIYPEYVNGCVEDHEPPRKVVLVIEESVHQNGENQ
jgi:ribosomal protein L37AE/L43A